MKRSSFLAALAVLTLSFAPPAQASNTLTDAERVFVAHRLGCSAAQVTITDLTRGANQSSWLATCGDKNRAVECVSDGAKVVCARTRPPAA